MTIIDIIGYIAALLTTASFVPQVIKSNRTKNLKDISLKTCLFMTSGVCMWFIYGVLTGSVPIVVANVITALLSSRILYLKIKFG